MTLKEIKDFKGYLGAHYTAYTMKEFFSEANAVENVFQSYLGDRYTNASNIKLQYGNESPHYVYDDGKQRLIYKDGEIKPLILKQVEETGNNAMTQEPFVVPYYEIALNIFLKHLPEGTDLNNAYDYVDSFLSTPYEEADDDVRALLSWGLDKAKHYITGGIMQKLVENEEKEILANKK